MTKLEVVMLLSLCGGGLGMAQTAADNPLAKSKVFPYESMPVQTGGNGAERRGVVRGVLATGESIGIHESMQPAGAVPNPAHKIEHSEVIVVQEGTLEFEHDGKTERVGPGGVIYVAFGTMHRVKNGGNTPVKYVVIQIGGDTK